jgi:hypothetical protein
VALSREWTTTSYPSDPNGGNCVQVRRVDGGVEVRSSKRPGAGTIFFSEGEWTAFLHGAKDSEFDL